MLDFYCEVAFDFFTNQLLYQLSYEGIVGLHRINLIIIQAYKCF